MPKGSPELTASRKEEIINACEKLYQTMSFKEITIRDIGAVTTFTRTSIYNYFQTKEEIFLSLMQREYELWAAEVNTLAEEHNTMSANDFAAAMAHSLEKHEQLLKLLAMNHYDMEENSRPERLTEFKVAYGASLDAVRACVKKFFPETDCESFIFVFFPFLFGFCRHIAGRSPPTGEESTKTPPRKCRLAGDIFHPLVLVVWPRFRQSGNITRRKP